jgi:hypothetical protein
MGRPYKARVTEWESLPRGVTWTSPPLLLLTGTRTMVARRFGSPSIVDADSNGLGSFDAWPIRFSCGLEVCLWVFRLGPDLARVADDDPTPIEVYANRPEADHVLFHLALPVPDAMLLPSSSSAPPLAFRVVRQDDHGNIVEVARYASRCEATAASADLEARGHKQTYTVQADVEANADGPAGR